MSHLIEIDLTVVRGDFRLAVRCESDDRALGVFGPSGAGKSTLLAAIAGLTRDAAGRIAIGGAVWLDTSAGIFLPTEARGVGYVPQEGLLFPHLDVMGNLMAGRVRARRVVRPAGPSIDRVVAVLELAGLAGRHVGDLSGGERQRVALGRALLSGPDLLLLDEPLAGLDLPLRRRILPYLVRVREEFHLPTLFVSHDPAEVQALCGDVVALGAGRVIAQGPPGRLFTRPEVFALARGEGYENILKGRLTSSSGATVLLTLPGGASIMVTRAGTAVAGEALVGVRAEDLILATSRPQGLSAQNILPGRIARIEREPGEAGSVMVIVEIGAPPTPVVVAITDAALEQLALAPGQEVHVIAKAQACHVVTVL